VNVIRASRIGRRIRRRWRTSSTRRHRGGSESNGSLCEWYHVEFVRKRLEEREIRNKLKGIEMILIDWNEEFTSIYTSAYCYCIVL
jgi:hypothetical protein